MYLRDYLFPRAQHPPGFTVVAVNESSDPLRPWAGEGLHVVSPEETRHAMIFAIKRDMDLNLPLDDWLKVALSLPVQFMAVPESDMIWVATTIRETVGAQFEVVYYSTVPFPSWSSEAYPPSSQSSGLMGRDVVIVFVVAINLQVQRIFQIMALKDMKEKESGRKLSVQDVVSLYNSKVSISSGETVNSGFVDSATVVWETVLKHGPLQKLVVAATLQTASSL